MKVTLADNQELAVCAALLPRSGATLATCRKLFHTPDRQHTTSIVERIKALSLATEEERNGKVLLVPTPQTAPKGLQRVFFRKIKEVMIKTLTPRQITQLTALSAHCDYETGDLFCSVEKVADWLHISQRQAIRLLKSMQQKELITRISRGHYVLNYVEISSTAVAKRCAVVVQEVTTTPPPAAVQEDTPTPPAYQEATTPPQPHPAELEEGPAASGQRETDHDETTPTPAAGQTETDHDETTPAEAPAPAHTPTPAMATASTPAARLQDVRDIATWIGTQRETRRERVRVCRELRFGGLSLDEGQRAFERGAVAVELNAVQIAMLRRSERADFRDYGRLLVSLNDYFRNDTIGWERDAKTLADKLTITRPQLAAYLATHPNPVEFINRDVDKLLQLATDIKKWVGAEAAKTKETIIKQLQRINSAECRTA